jgi:hypothetical protein
VKFEEVLLEFLMELLGVVIEVKGIQYLLKEPEEQILMEELGVLIEAKKMY